MMYQPVEPSLDVLNALTSGGGLAGVDVSDDDDVDMSLFLTVEETMLAMSIDMFSSLNTSFVMN
jgi:hypothetical protein